MPVSIAEETPLQDDVRILVAELNAVLHALTPPEYCHQLTVEQMAEPTVTVWLARDGETPIGCGALKRHTIGTGEVKRMYTRPAVQGQGIGKRVLATIMEKARREGMKELVLETGDRHHAA